MLDEEEASQNLLTKPDPSPTYFIKKLMVKAPVVNALKLDDILIKFNINGRYYVGFIILILFLYMTNRIHCNNYVFTAEKVNYWCADARFGNDSCASLGNSTEVCTEWVYDDPHSFVAEFQLACQEWKRTLVGSVHNFGYGIGLMIIGPLSDRFGRKTLLIWIAVIGALTGTLKSFATNYWVFLILEFMEAAFGDAFSPIYILMIEMVAHEKRVLTKNMCAIGYGIGNEILPLTAWLSSNWRQMILILYTPAILFITYIYLLDESPRWLLSRGRKEKAVAVLNKMAKRSKVVLDENIFNHLSHEVNKEASLKESLKNTFASGVLLRRFFIGSIWWTSASFVSFGLSINSVLLPGNKYINYGLMGLTEFPAILLTLWILSKFRRKNPLIATFFISAVFCFAQSVVPRNLQWLSVILFLGAKLVSKIIFSTIYIYTSEMFPTYTRNSMHALCSALGRVGSTLAPQTPLLMVYWSGLPSLVFGVAALLAGLATMFAPDLGDDALPDTVRQAETSEIIQQRRATSNADNLHGTE